MNSIHSQIYRTKEILGVSIPGIIYNGSYFFVDLGVYEDGRVECWNFEDFEHFKNDVNCGWVSVNIPDGEEISVHGLGSWKIDRGNWNYSKQSFIDYVYSLVKMLNPKLENLYTHSIRKVNGVIIAESGSGKTFKEKKAGPTDLFPTKEVGKSVNLFFKAKDQRYYLSKLEMYAEDALVLNRIPEPFEFDLSQLEEMISSQKILTD
ncbi:MAG TPA: hypothetical protein ENJ82_05125, partial [Bacteroidetes bacterium]|nr:hypothetical protein [Bacteroidota bacterium]